MYVIIRLLLTCRNYISKFVSFELHPQKHFIVESFIEYILFVNRWNNFFRFLFPIKGFKFYYCFLFWIFHQSCLTQPMLSRGYLTFKVDFPIIHILIFNFKVWSTKISLKLVYLARYTLQSFIKQIRLETKLKFVELLSTIC